MPLSSDLQDQFCDLIGNLCNGQIAGESHGKAQNDHHGAGRHGRARSDLIQIAEFHVLIDEETNDQGIDHRDAGGLGWCEDTRIDTAQHDKGRQQGPFACPWRFWRHGTMRRIGSDPW